MSDQATSGLSAVATHVVSAISVSAIVGAIIGVVPTLAVCLAVVWYVIAIWETKTIQTWWHHRQVDRVSSKAFKLTRKIAELQRQGKRSAQELHRLEVEADDELVEPSEDNK